ncbi:MAG: ABC transporter permease, partial [Clostridia bacterium]|nr:ABC transporter permease [Clostridia bacterium]
REIARTDYNISVSAEYADKEEYQKLLDTVSFDHVQDCSVVRVADIEISGRHISEKYANCINMTLNEEDTDYIAIASVGDEQFAKYCASLGLDPAKTEGKGILCDYCTVRDLSEGGDGELKYLRMYSFEKGDVITGFSKDGDDKTKKTVPIEVAAISEEKPFGLEYWGVDLIVSDKLFDQFSVNHTLMNLLYRTDDSDKLQDEVESHLQGLSYELNNSDENFRKINNLYTLFGVFLYGFIIVISLIGVTSIFNTITTNMELRRPEFAMLRSVGMTNREFNRMIRLESLFMGTRSLLFGVPIGILLSYVIYHFMAEEAGYPFELPALSILIATAAVFVLISLIMAYSMGKIKKQNTIETIRNENI